MRLFSLVVIVLIFLADGRRTPTATFDVIIRNGTIYDGTGDDPFIADVAIQADTIAAIGNLEDVSGREEFDATGLAVSPGFINMLSWAQDVLLKDGSAMSDIKQGVTMEVFGEGWSPGPVRRTNRKPADSLWTTLGGYFDYAMKKGVSCNIASFVGATTVRIHVMDHVARKPTFEELRRMEALVAEAMEEGALGLGTSLIYPPATFAETDELIALARVAGTYGGIYITHMRSEADNILAAVDEVLTISREAKVPAEIYHLKVNIARNWPKIDTILARIDSARAAGMKITANMYPYTASATGLSSRIPAWVQEGGAVEMRKRLKNPQVRRRVLYEMEKGIPYKNSDPENVVLTYFRLDSLNRLYRGKTLKEIARLHGKNADETVLDLVIRDKSRIEALYYLQSEENIAKIIRQPYVSFGSDAGAYTIASDSLLLPDHPRAFGTFARVLGRYVREKNRLTLQEAVRKLTQLPATNLRLQKRGNLRPGYFADLAIFDPGKIIDKATFTRPHAYAEGMVHVFVNGVQVLRNGAYTGSKPGRVVRGQGYKSP